METRLTVSRETYRQNKTPVGHDSCRGFCVLRFCIRIIKTVDSVSHPGETFVRLQLSKHFLFSLSIDSCL